MKAIIPAILALLLFASAEAPVDYTTRVFEVEEASCIYLEGSSNINEFTCKCQQEFEPLTMTYEVTPQGHTIFKNTGIKFRTKNLDCDNSKLNKDMWETLKVDRYPYIEILLKEVRFQGNGLDPKTGWIKMTAEADITVAGVTLTRELAVEGLQESPNSFRFISNTEFLMSDFKLDPPSPLFGLIKVNNEVNINFDLFITLPEQG